MFLNTELQPMIEYCVEKGIAVFLGSTNFNVVQDGLLESLVRLQVRSLMVAIDGATPETYSSYRVGGDFLKVLANIREVNKFKAVYHLPFPELTWQFVVFGHNEHELPIAKALAKELGMVFVSKLAWDSNLSPIRDARSVMQETGWSATNRDESFAINKRHYMADVCRALWRSPRVNWDGRVVGCCWSQESMGGNVFRDGYLRAINAEKIRYARKMLMGKAAPRDDVACSRCQIYKTRRSAADFMMPEMGPLRRQWLRLLHRSFGLQFLRKCRHK